MIRVFIGGKEPDFAHEMRCAYCPGDNSRTNTEDAYNTTRRSADGAD